MLTIFCDQDEPLVEDAAKEGAPPHWKTSLDAELLECLESIDGGTTRINERMQRLRRIAAMLESQQAADVSEIVHRVHRGDVGTRGEELRCRARAGLHGENGSRNFVQQPRATPRSRRGRRKLTGGPRVRVRVGRKERTVVLEIAHAKERVSDPWGAGTIDFKWIRAGLADVQATLELLVGGDEATFRITFPSSPAVGH
jgi:hypothetical protein